MHNICWILNIRIKIEFKKKDLRWNYFFITIKTDKNNFTTHIYECI